MLKGFTIDGELKDIKVNEDGSIPVGGNVEISNNDSKAIPVNVKNNGNIGVEVNNSGNIGVNVNNTSAIPVSLPENVEIDVTQTSDKEITLNSSIQTLSTTATTIAINNKVTLIMIANYSEEADVTVGVGNKTYQVGASLALELPMNETITSLSLTATAADTKVQLVVKGVE